MNQLDRFSLYSERMPKVSYSAGQCIRSVNLQTTNVHIAPVYSSALRPNLSNVDYVPYMLFDYDIKLSDYNFTGIRENERADLYTEFLVDNLQEVGLKPTLAVATGGGAHLYYEIHHRDASDKQKLNSLYKNFATKQLLLESGLDTSSCHVVSTGRYPGSYNEKHNNYPVHINNSDDIIYTSDSLEEIILSLSDIEVANIQQYEGRNTTIYRQGIALLSTGLSLQAVATQLQLLYKTIKDDGDHYFSQREFESILYSLSKAQVNVNSKSEYVQTSIRRFETQIDRLHITRSKRSNRVAQYVLRCIVEQYAKVTGSIFPISQNHLANMCGIPQPQISRILRKMLDKGILYVVEDKYVRGKKSKVYALNFLFNGK